MLQPNDLQLIILDCPYRSWDKEMVQQLFPKMVSLKLKGYQHSYGKTVMPIDTTDFLATHLLVCSKIDGKFVPVMGFRSIELSRCQEFNVPFSALSLAKAALDGELHVPYVEGSIQRCMTQGIPLFYISSWTIHPDIRTEEKILTQQMTSLFASLIWQQHQHHNSIQVIAAASIQFRVTQLLGLLGFELAQNAGQELPSFGVASLCQTRARLMELRKFSPYAAQLAKKYQALWDNRIVIDDDQEALTMREAG